jgi:hypothetical protein
MNNKVRPIDLAGRFGVSKQVINKYITQGMPIDSVESAEAWLNSRRAAGNSNFAVDGDFNRTVEKQRELTQLAYEQYRDDLRNNPPDAPKSYATYDKAAKTLLAFEKEQTAREIASREYIRTQTAIERFGRVFAQVREELTTLGSKIASKANPDNPGKAMKVIDEEAKRLLERVSASASYAEQAVVDGTNEDEPVEVEETEESVDEVQSDEDRLGNG